MKTGIFFFTGTGNSLRSVNILKEQLEEKGELVDICDISKQQTFNISNYNKVGIVFPIYCLGIPSIIKSFINSNKFVDNQYIFAVANCGSNSGIAFNQINKLLKKDDKKLNFTLTLKSGSNNNLFINIPGTSKILSEEEQLIAKEICIKNIIEASDVIYNMKDQLQPRVRSLDYIKSLMAHYIFMKGLKNYALKFRTTKDCKSCGKCIKNCPAHNIEEGVKWKTKCVACLRCFTICPNQAIEQGKMSDPRMFKRIKINNDIKDYINK